VRSRTQTLSETNTGTKCGGKGRQQKGKSYCKEEGSQKRITKLNDKSKLITSDISSTTEESRVGPKGKIYGVRKKKAGGKKIHLTQLGGRVD